MFLVLVPHGCALQEFQKAQLQFGREEFEDLFKTEFDVVPVIQRQSYNQVQVHVYMVFQLQDDTLGLVKILLTAYLQVGLLVDGLDANFKTEHPRWNLFFYELHDGRMKDICSDLELKNIVWAGIVEDELENIQREILFNIEGPVQKFDHPPMRHQVQEVALDMIGGQVANAIVQAGQAEFAFVRTAPRGFDVEDAVAERFWVFVLVRIGVGVFFQRKVNPLLLVDQFTILFGHNVVDGSNMRILLQECGKRNLTFSRYNEIDTVHLNDFLPIVGYFWAAQQYFCSGIQLLDFFSHCQCLGDVPDIATETDHIKMAAMGSYLVRVFLDGKLLPTQPLIAFVQFVQKPDGQIHVDVLGVQRGQ